MSQASPQEAARDLEKASVQGGEAFSNSDDSGASSVVEEKPTPDESILVDWDGPNDPQNPQNWSLSRKWWLVGLVAAVTFNM
jgi:hypothetical protein